MSRLSRKMTDELNAWKSQMIQPLWHEDEKWFRVHSRNHIRIIEGHAEAEEQGR